MTSLNDLNSISCFGGLTLSQITVKEKSIEPRSHCICATGQISFPQRIQPLRGALWGQQECSFILLLGSISHHGFRATDISRKLARHRSLSRGPAAKALSLRLQWPRQTCHSGRCQRDSRLAHLSRLCPESDRDSTSTVCSFRVRRRTRCHCLRLRRHYHRSLSVALSLGQIQKAQGRGQSPRRAHAGAGLIHRHGSWLPRLPTALPIANGAYLLCHSHQKQSAVSAALLPSPRPHYRGPQRSDHCLDWSINLDTLSHRSASSALLRRRNRPANSAFNQQLFHPRRDGRGTLSLSLANRTLLQMDQTTSPHQKLFWHFQQQRQDSSLDSHHGLCARCHRQETFGTQARSLHFVTDPESHSFRENPHFKLASAISIQS